VWAPHDPWSFFGHIVFGAVAYSAGIAAIWSTKGSRTHVRAGRLFSIGMSVASITALVFMVDRFLPLALVMAVSTLYLLATGISAIRHDRAYARWIERVAAVVPLGLAVLVGFQVLRILRGAPQPLTGPALLVLILGGLFVADVRLAARRFSSPVQWRKRHLFRMMLAFGFATTAVLNINSGALGIPLEYTVVVPLGVALIVGFAFVRREDQARTV